MGWRAETRAVIREYPRLKRAEAELKMQSLTPSLTGMPGGTEVSRTTENVAIRTLPPKQQRKLDAVRYAIETTTRYRNGELRIRLIDLIYWRKTHTLTGAAMKIHVAEITAKNWHNDFVELVDAYMRIL